MSNKYKYGSDRHAHFVTYTVVQWIDFFIREEYRTIFVKAIQHYQQEKCLEVYGYCIMTSHIHLIVRSGEGYSLEELTRDLKGYTSKAFRKILEDEKINYESRKSWMLWMMKKIGLKKSNNKGFQFWQQDSHPIELWSDEVFFQKLNYIHMNPVVSGFVTQPEHWYYSSARNHAGLPGILELAEL
jgi:putative transposase